jgi:hypothetical protein
MNKTYKTILCLLLLSITAHAESVMVSSNVGCSATHCLSYYNVDETVTLIPKTYATKYHAGWISEVCSGVGNCVFTVTPEMAAKGEVGAMAIYSYNTKYTLYVHTFGGTEGGKVVTAPNGDLGILCPSVPNTVCYSNFKKDELVTIYALYPVDMKVVWHGADCNGNTCDVKMSKTLVVNVEFTK